MRYSADREAIVAGCDALQTLASFDRHSDRYNGNSTAEDVVLRTL
jgi:hypothetical protein